MKTHCWMCDGWFDDQDIYECEDCEGLFCEDCLIEGRCDPCHSDDSDDSR